MPSFELFSSKEIIDFFQRYYDIYGYQLIFFGALFENIFPIAYFVPGSTIVWLGAFYAYSGELSILQVFVLGTIGAFLGHNVDYVVGRFGWYKIFKRFVKEEKLQEAGKYFEKNRYLDALVIYFIGYTRSFLIMAMGLFQIGFKKFLTFSFLAAFIWNLTFLTVGFYFGSQRELLERGLNLFWLAGLVMMSFYLLPKFFNGQKILEFFDKRT